MSVKKITSVMKKILSIFSIAGFVIFLVTSAWAADYPTKAITIINPFAPGGSPDLQCRAFAAVAEKFMGKPMVVVNKVGATGMIGFMSGAQAAPDGYTLTLGGTTTTCTLAFETANGRKAITRQDFIPLGSFTLSPALIVTYYDSPWKTLADFIKDAKAKPGHYAFSSGGLYGGSHLPAEVFARTVGLKFRHVPYGGGGPALSALVGKHVDFATQYPLSSLPLVEGKKLRVLAVQGDKRLKNAPDVPTVKELGIDAEYYMWNGILAPKNTPAAIVEKLREVVKKTVQEKAFIDAIETPGDEVRFMNADEQTRFWEKESEMTLKIMTQLVKEAPAK
jgi:tripartite-type tricarboxylate transporter receptor subunit TctC